jgi:hypothetical protein
VCPSQPGYLWKSFLFNLVFANKRVRKIFGSGEMYRNVAPHAQSPPSISPSAKLRRKHKSGILNPILGEQTVYLIQDFDPFLVSISQFVGQFPANCRVGRFLHGTSRSTATGIIVRRQAFPVPITALAPV